MSHPQDHRSRLDTYHSDASDPTDRRTDHLQSDIDRTRAQMDETIDELSDRLRPRSLFDDLLNRLGIGNPGGAVGSAAGAIAASAGGAVAHAAKDAAAQVVQAGSNAMMQTCRRHPLPSAVIGAGIMWMITERMTKNGGASHAAHSAQHKMRGAAQAAGHHLSDAASSVRGAAASAGHRVTESVTEAGHAMRDTASDAMHRAGEGLTHAGHRIREEASHAADRMRDGARVAGDRMRDGYEYSCEKTRDAFEEYPLGFAAGAVAAGVLLGLMMPHTRPEDRWMGERSRQARDQVWDMARETADRAKSVAGSTAEAARAEAERQGLTPSQVKRDVKSVAKVAASTASQEARRETEDMKREHHM